MNNYGIPFPSRKARVRPQGPNQKLIPARQVLSHPIDQSVSVTTVSSYRPATTMTTFRDNGQELSSHRNVYASSSSSSCCSPRNLTVRLFRFLLLFILLLSLADLQPAQAQSCPARCNNCRGRVANCRGRSLTAPPRSYPRGTRIVDLKGNHIRMLGSRSFRRLTSVEILKVNVNKITSLRHHAFRAFPNLATVDLSQNLIYRISHDALTGARQLRTLLLNRNRIGSLRDVFRGVPFLYQLNLAKNRIRSIGENDLVNLPGLSSLDLRNNRIHRIHPRAFRGMPRLRSLFLEGNPMSQRLPELQFGALRLKVADFSRCHLTAVPKTFPASLSDFRLSYNNISQVNYTDFTNIQDLELLALNDNNLYFFADGSLAHMPRLKEAWLRRNRLGYIPRDLPNNLQRLQMDSNQLQEIEPGLFSNDSQLSFLTVANNQIRRLLPDTFTGMGVLAMLNFQGNAITALEAGAFRHLPSLQTLLVSNNPLRRVAGGAFHDLPGMTYLYMSYISQDDFQIDDNFLAEMPNLQKVEMMASPALAEDLMRILDLADPLLSTLDQLHTLDLSYNTLEALSPNLPLLFPNLRALPLDGNPFRCTQSLRWLQQWMVEAGSQISFSHNMEPTCDSPPHLYGRTLLSLADHEWGPDDADRGAEYLDAFVVNQHAARMARDSPAGHGPGGRVNPLVRSSHHTEIHSGERKGDSLSDNRIGSRSDNRIGSLSDNRIGSLSDNRIGSRSTAAMKEGSSTALARVLPKLDHLEERANREKRRRKKLRSSMARRRGKGKKNRRRGKKRGRGKKRKGMRANRKSKITKNEKRAKL